MIVLALTLASAGASALLVLALFPLMRRYALARPNARSSHRVPTPQGGGIAVIAASLALAALAIGGGGIVSAEVATLAAAVVVLAIVGAVDDILPLPVAPRLALQALCVGAVVFTASATSRVLGADVPLGLEVAIATLAGLWFVNLTNFMDGLDWLTVAAVVPLCAALTGLGVAGVTDPTQTVVAAVLLGALLGFAPFNKPVARLFLGDVGALPIGLLVAWLLYGLAAQGHVAAAVILPLYSCADASLTLVRRAARRERIWEAHRSHFYQRATEKGFSAMRVSGTIFAANLALALLAALTVAAESVFVDVAVLFLACAIVAGTLALFAQPRGVAEASR